jgi:aminoglycoside phosphotransferase (APT) family kinase protein
MSIEDCLPAELRGPSTTITRVGAGMSGAGVYRVDAAGRAFVLKVSSEAEPSAAWRARFALLQIAASAGVAPRLVHHDEARRAVLSDFVVDRSFATLFAQPHTREQALVLLAQLLRRVHALTPPPGIAPSDARAFLVQLWSGLSQGSALPGFARAAVQRVLDEPVPAHDRALGLSHNDVNPTNLAYDGEQLFLLDWDTSGLNEPFHDLATIAVFLRMDDATCGRLLALHDDQPESALPARFLYDRRLVAALCGSMFVHLALQGGPGGAAGSETAETTPSLAEFYQRLRSGQLSLAAPEGRWLGGLALLKESAAL